MQADVAEGKPDTAVFTRSPGACRRGKATGGVITSVPEGIEGRRLLDLDPAAPMACCEGVT